MLMRLEELGLGYHRRNDIPDGIKPQPSALKYAQKDPIVRESDWLIVFDADEFLVVKYGDGTLDSVISAAGDAHALVITWRTFGSGFVEEWSRDPVTEQYTYAAPAMWNKGWGVKTLFRFDHEIWKLGIHRPSMKKKILDTDYPNTIHWLNGSGLPMEDYFKYRGWRSIRRTVGYDWLQMNHYAVKSIDAYAIRKFRGNVNNKADKYNSDYWSLQDRNEVKEPSVLRHSQKRAEIMVELLKDPILKKLNFEAIERVEARLAEYKKTDAYEELKAGLIEAGKVPINEVVAKPPQARDPSKIAALMSDIEAKNSERPKQERRNKAIAGFRSSGKSTLYNPEPLDMSMAFEIESYSNHDVMLPADARVFTTEALDDLTNSKFDRRNARHIANLLEPTDRLLNIGSGISFIPMVACLHCMGLTVLAQEERKDLKKLAVDIAAENNLSDSSRLKIVDGPLFFATDTNEQASGLRAYVLDFKPSVLRICDPRITFEILAKLPLDRVRRVIHIGIDPKKDNEAMDELAKALPKFGYNDSTERAGIAVMDRVEF
jgi:hypothetical protein